MQRLSSSLTVWWYKRLGPLLLCVAFITTAAILAVNIARGAISPAWLVVLILLGVVFLAYLRWFIFSLADEVFDDREALVIHRRFHTTRLPIADITSVDYSLIFDPPRIIIRATTASGEKTITFMPYLFGGMCFFRPHPLLADLRARIHGDSPAGT
jgi:hypothetical protein